MSPSEAAVIMFGTFGVLIVLRIPVSFALALACVPMMFAWYPGKELGSLKPLDSTLFSRIP